MLLRPPPSSICLVLVGSKLGHAREPILGVRTDKPSDNIHPRNAPLVRRPGLSERDGRPLYSQRDLWEATTHEKRQGPEWIKQIEYSGTTFFDGMNFFSEPDPSNGLVEYVDGSTAFGEGLAFWTQNGTPGIQAEHWARTEEGTPRKSVRIHTKALFQGGLFLIDTALFPWGCGVWPAVWLLGYDQEWPYAGEVDLIEGVQAMTNNQMTVHTAPGCNLDQSTGLFSGTVANSNCDATTGNSGCSIVSSSNVSFGMRFNELGGGLFACLWDNDGFKMYNWLHSDIPQEGNTGRSVVVLAWSSSTCDPWAFFHPQQIVLNVNLCGDWAGQTYSQFDYCPETCASYITEPNNMNNTVMLINSIKVFQQAGRPVVSAQALDVRNQTGFGGGVGRKNGGGAPGVTLRGRFLLLLALSAALLVYVYRG